MQTHARSLLVLLLIAQLAYSAPLEAAGKPIGVVLQSDKGRAGSVALSGGTTIFVGDSVLIDHGGMARIRTRAGQVELAADSALTFEDASGGADATLLQGTAGFSSQADLSFALRASGMLVRPQGKQPSLGQVTVVSPTELIVTSFRGPLEVTYEDESVTVPESTTYKLTVQGDAQGPGPVGAGRDTARHRKLKAFLLAAAIVVLPMMAFVGYRLSVSPYTVF